MQTWQFSEPVTTLALTTDDALLLVALGGRLLLWNSAGDERTEFVTVEKRWPGHRLNDGGAAPDGSLWVGSMQNNVAEDGSEIPISESTGALYRVLPSGDVTIADAGFGITNTIVWNSAATHFYCGCSLEGVLYKYLYEVRTGSLGERSVFVRAAYPGVPDGSATDANDVLWNCRHSGKCILGFAPNGELIQTIDMPATHITNCVFGDDDLRTLYVTSASLGAPKGEMLAGNLFSIRMDTPGPEPFRFRV